MRLNTVVRCLLMMACLALLAMAQNQVIALDASRSTAAVAAAEHGEAAALADAVPTGRRAILFVVGGTVRRVFDGTLDARSRAEMERQIAATPATALNTDLGGAVAETLRAAAALPGQTDVWIYTDGENRPVPGSTDRGRSFRAILEGAAVPTGVELHVRLFGGGLDGLAQPNMFVHRTAPDYAAMYRKPPQPPALPPPPPDRRWQMAAIAVGICGLALLALGLLTRGRHRSREADLLAPVALSEPPAPAAPRLRLSYIVQPAGMASAVTVDDERRELTAGGDPLDDLPVPGAARVRFRLAPEGGRVSLVNEGAEGVWVGRRCVPPGGSVELPGALVEIRIGEKILRAYPEVEEAR